MRELVQKYYIHFGWLKTGRFDGIQRFTKAYMVTARRASRKNPCKIHGQRIQGRYRKRTRREHANQNREFWALWIHIRYEKFVGAVVPTSWI